MDIHKQAVATIATSVRSYFLRKEPYRIFHGSTNSTRPRSGDAHRRTVDISPLHHVLEVDTARRTALVEPNVPMDHLVASTLAHGLLPPVVMEFPGITAGGGFAGTAGESSSFRHGFFNENINKVEMVLANGDVVEASPRVDDPRQDLFHGAAGALGTLGITTLMELQLVQSRKYVKTTYHRRRSIADTISLLREATETSTPNDYVDGILFSKDHGVVVTGELTDEEPAAPQQTPVQTFSHPRDPWFYLHVKEHTDGVSVDQPVVEYVPLAEYLFRYDRGGFWVGRSAFSYWPFPFNRWTRRALDDFLHTRMLYQALHASGQSSTYVVQDLGLPYDSAEAFIDYTSKVFGIWPLWLCPLKAYKGPSFHPHTTDAVSGAPRPMLNIGLWGPGPADAQQCVALNQDLEKRLHCEFGGRKWFYAHAYYDEDAFWEIYDRPAYEALRTKYNATTLPSVFDKLKVDASVTATRSHVASGVWARWPLAGIYGLNKAIASKAYLPRTPPWRA